MAATGLRSRHGGLGWIRMVSPPSQPSRAEITALLAWYVEMGVDVALEEQPADRFALAAIVAPKPPAAAAAAPLLAEPAAPPRLLDAVAPSEDVARAARTTAKT